MFRHVSGSYRFSRCHSVAAGRRSLIALRHRCPPADAGARTTTTLDDQAELAVTVYNSDIALVRDVRNLQLARGTSDLQFMDIAATVNPATVHFRSLTEPSRVSVLEQNYEYDLLEPDKLLRKYVGRDVTLVRTRQRTERTRRGRSEGAASQLQQRAGLADRQRDRDRHARRSHPVSRAARAISISRPTLIWTLDNGGGTRTASRPRIWPASCRGTPTTC